MLSRTKAGHLVLDVSDWVTESVNEPCIGYLVESKHCAVSFEYHNHSTIKRFIYKPCPIQDIDESYFKRGGNYVRLPELNLSYVSWSTTVNSRWIKQEIDYFIQCVERADLTTLAMLKSGLSKLYDLYG